MMLEIQVGSDRVLGAEVWIYSVGSRGRFYFIEKIFYWSIVDLQCCVSFGCTAM